jgi:hypothetical protein
MTDNDYNIIKPIESLRNIAGLASAKHREEKKRRQNTKDEHESKNVTEEQNNSASQQNHSNIPTNDQAEQHTIDYCA